MLCECKENAYGSRSMNNTSNRSVWEYYPKNNEPFVDDLYKPYTVQSQSLPRESINQQTCALPDDYLQLQRKLSTVATQPVDTRRCHSIHSSYAQRQIHDDIHTSSDPTVKCVSAGGVSGVRPVEGCQTTVSGTGRTCQLEKPNLEDNLVHPSLRRVTLGQDFQLAQPQYPAPPGWVKSQDGWAIKDWSYRPPQPLFYDSTRSFTLSRTGHIDNYLSSGSATASRYDPKTAQFENRSQNPYTGEMVVYHRAYSTAPSRTSYQGLPSNESYRRLS